MWIAAFVAGGALAGWPAALVLLKPSLSPFALIAIRDRRFWVAVAVLLAVSIPFGERWIEYAQVMRDVRSVPLTYSLLNVPIVAAPVVVWFGRRRADAGQLATGTSRDRSGRTASS